MTNGLIRLLGWTIPGFQTCVRLFAEEESKRFTIGWKKVGTNELEPVSTMTSTCAIRPLTANLGRTGMELGLGRSLSAPSKTARASSCGSPSKST
jgi:hypothetical protein